MAIISRNDLAIKYQDILNANGIIKDGLEFKIENNDNPIITQSTSGSRNEPLVIPRHYNDVADIINRFLIYYNNHFNRSPQKVAMLGGISHIMAASSIKVDDIQIKFFDFLEFDKILDWKPEIITCYPSILREMLFKYGNDLKFLKAIKLGGEKLFPSDCEAAFELLPDILIIEQYGSTEMPGLAFRNINRDNFQFRRSHITVPFELQVKRFSYLNIHKVGWHPFIAKDNFPELLFKIEDYYDTGDEALWEDNKPIDFRRRCDIENDYWDSINFLLGDKFINLQLDLENKFIISEHYTSDSIYKFNNTSFVTKKGQLKRVSSSNKLPLIVSVQK